MKRVLVLFLIAAGPLFAQGPGGGTGDSIWTRNAAYGEAETFDLCNGHQPQTGMYHHHVNPICLRAQLNDNVVTGTTGRVGTKYGEAASGWRHSPIVGWAYDGYPVYGPYGYSNPQDSSSPIKRIKPSFRLRSITQRHTLPDWVLPYEPNVSQNLNANQYGPDVSAKFPLGRYVQDYDYLQGLGDLDQYNGRFTVTPEYPNGTYAYFVTVADDGSPAFPYVINVQYYGTPAGGNSPTVASDAVDYFNNGALTQATSADPQLASWYTRGSQQFAQAISGFDPSAGPSTTWPVNAPSGATINGGNRTPALTDVQRLRYDGGLIFMNSNNLPSYTIGPWFEATMTGGVFMNWASSSSQQIKLPRSPSPATTKSASGMGPVGMWVNGVAIFNTLDGGSYSNAQGDDQGGGMPSARAAHASAASFERGPIAAGSLVAAFAEFAASLATSTQSAASPDWPLTLGGATVNVTDSTGAVLPARISYASAGQVNYQMPAGAATGFGRVTITAGGTAVSGTVNIVATYPSLFAQTSDGLAAGQVLRVHNGQQTLEAISTVNSAGQATPTPVALNGDQVYLILYGTGIGTAATTASMAGVNAAVSYSGAQGTYPGLDQLNILIPSTLAGTGRVDILVSAASKPSNRVYFVVQ